MTKSFMPAAMARRSASIARSIRDSRSAAPSHRVFRGRLGVHACYACQLANGRAPPSVSQAPTTSLPP
jgi:hypothetical protein